VWQDAAMPHRRFDRTARLFGDDLVERLGRATVTVMGVGGVGSFAAEALVRSGVGRVILVDYDRICVTNVNRQLHAARGTLGKPKVAVMAERLRAINPDAVIEARAERYAPETAARLLTPEPDVVVDAIDHMTAKLHLIATCLRDRVRVVSAMGAAARLDPTAVRVADLAETRMDPFARDLRRGLRLKHGVDCQQPLGVWAVYSEEAPIAPQALAYDDGAFRCVCPGGHNGHNDCEHRHRVEGSAAFVPGAFGLTAAATAVKVILGAMPARRARPPAPRRPDRRAATAAASVTGAPSAVAAPAGPDAGSPAPEPAAAR
jgi:tRNA A37 threonylcarbamoyladenosine dehydratase